MAENIQKSPSLNLTHLKQRLEYFERHIRNSNNQEVRKEYFRTLAQVIEAENALRHFVKVFYNDRDRDLNPIRTLKDDNIDKPITNKKGV
jgi:hypothetical protein